MDPDVRVLGLMAMSAPRADRYESDPIFVHVGSCQNFAMTGISAISQQLAPNGYEPQQPSPFVDLEVGSPIMVQDIDWNPSFPPPSSASSAGDAPMASPFASPKQQAPQQQAPQQQAHLPIPMQIDMHGAFIAGSPIHYELQPVTSGHRILLFKPTPAQWADFPSIFALARRLGAAAEGCFKMLLPLEMRDPLPSRAPQRLPAIAYKVRQIRARTTWQVSTVRTEGIFSSAPSSFSSPADEAYEADEADDVYSATPEEAIKALKTLFMKNKDRRMRNVLYRPDVPAWTPKQRREAGVPPRSPIHPLGGDLLDSTKAIIPGLHTPYVYESAPHFGASFQLHAEDYRLTSLNHLYKGRKIWIVVPATAVDIAEKALDRRNNCSQFMRHRAEFFFPDRFDKMGIPYRIVDQRPGETIVVLPDAYHEGFSTGYTLAEAKNYADSEWTDQHYQPCEARCNLATAIPGEYMRPIKDGEERVNLCTGYESEDSESTDLDTLTDRSPAHFSSDSVLAAVASPGTPSPLAVPPPRAADAAPSSAASRPKKRRMDNPQDAAEDHETMKHRKRR